MGWPYSRKRNKEFRSLRNAALTWYVDCFRLQRYSSARREQRYHIHCNVFRVYHCTYIHSEQHINFNSRQEDASDFDSVITKTKPESFDFICDR